MQTIFTRHLHAVTLHNGFRMSDQLYRFRMAAFALCSTSLVALSAHSAAAQSDMDDLFDGLSDDEISINGDDFDEAFGGMSGNIVIPDTDGDMSITEDAPVEMEDPDTADTLEDPDTAIAQPRPDEADERSINLEDFGVSFSGDDMLDDDVPQAGDVPTGSAPQTLQDVTRTQDGQPTGMSNPMVSDWVIPDFLEVGDGQDYEVDPDGDPLTEAVTEILREGGLLQRQEEIGQSLLLMDRQSRFVGSVNQLLNLLGPDAEIEVAPGVYQRFEDTPIGRQALIARLNQEREVIAAQVALDQAEFDRVRQQESFEQEIESEVEARLDERVEQEREMLLGAAEREAERIESEAIDTARSTMSEAEEEAELTREQAQIEVAEMRAEAEAYRDELVAELEELRAQEREKLAALEQREAELAEREEEIASLDLPEFDDMVDFSLQEIYGSSGRYEAIIQRGGANVRVRAGDRLPDGPEITRINRDFLEFEFLGQTRRLTL